MYRYSVGHPSIMRHDFDFKDRYFGLVKVPAQTDLPRAAGKV